MEAAGRSGEFPIGTTSGDCGGVTKSFGAGDAKEMSDSVGGDEASALAFFFFFVERFFLIDLISLRMGVFSFLFLLSELLFLTLDDEGRAC